MAVREGKSIIQVVLKEEMIKQLDKIAKIEITSRSAIAGKIIEDNIDKYLNEKSTP